MRVQVNVSITGTYGSVSLIRDRARGGDTHLGTSGTWVPVKAGLTTRPGGCQLLVASRLPLAERLLATGHRPTAGGCQPATGWPPAAGHGAGTGWPRAGSRSCITFSYNLCWSVLCSV